MKEHKILTRQVELAFAQAFFSYLYRNKLLTSDELTKIRNELKKRNVFIGDYFDKDGKPNE